MEKKFKSCRDLDLDLTLLNIELVQAIFTNYNVFKFHVYRILFEFRAHTHTHTHTQTHTHTPTHTHTQTHTHTPTHTHTHTHTHMHACTHAHTHMNTHRHRDIQNFRGGALGGCVFFIRGES